MSSGVTLVLCVTICVLYLYANTVQGDAVHRYNVNITERGTKFTETIEVGRNTVVYHVPDHNDVEKSDLLVDYTQKVTVVRIPRLQECQVESMNKDEHSPLKVMFDLVKVKRSYRTRAPPVRTIERTVMKIGKFLNASEAVKKFCGTFEIFRMETLNVVDLSKNYNQEPPPVVRKVTTDYLLRKLTKYYDNIHGETEKPTDDDGSDDATSDPGSSVDDEGYDDNDSTSGSGYETIREGQHCRTLGEYQLLECIDQPEEWELTTVRKSGTCAYRVDCRPAKFIDGELRKARCVEHHERRYSVCVDIACKPPISA